MSFIGKCCKFYSTIRAAPCARCRSLSASGCLSLPFSLLVAQMQIGVMLVSIGLMRPLGQGAVAPSVLALLRIQCFYTFLPMTVLKILYDAKLQNSPDTAKLIGRCFLATILQPFSPD